MNKTVYLTADDRLYILDQTLLPGQVRQIELTDKQSLVEAIRALRVRGAPAIGCAAALGVALLAARQTTPDRAALLADMDDVQASRPTAVNLSWALQRLRRVLARTPDAQLAVALRAEAQAIVDEDEQLCRRIGEHGLGLLRDHMRLLTHCNAGSLATAGLGTALAPIYLGLEQGWQLTVYCDETRPLLQGARLTAWEMQQAGADTVLLCDNMAASLMAAGRIDAVLVGADRIAANGDFANKIGTLSVAVNAAHFHVPFYVCAPYSTIDPATLSGADIPVEQRAADEVTELWYAERKAPPRVRVYNPAFDVTPAALVTAFITDSGVLRPPFDFSRISGRGGA